MSKTLRQLWLGDAPKDLGELPAYLEKSKALDLAYENFKKKKFEKIISMEYDAEMLGEKWIKVKEHEKFVRGQIKENIAKEHNNGYCFITINPEPRISLNDFRERVEKFANRNMFLKYRYVLEQRGTKGEEAGKGFHAHILCARNLDYKPSKISVNSKNTFKSMLNVNNPALLNIQHIGEDFAKDKDEYMTGVKTGEGKDEKQEIDKVWRKMNNLESVYGEQFF